MEYKSWADYHPEVAENAKTVRPWPCEKIDSGLGRIHQPSVVKSSNEELFVEAKDQSWEKGVILHSTDGGISWEILCTAEPLAPPRSSRMQSAATKEATQTVSQPRASGCRIPSRVRRPMVVDSGGVAFGKLKATSA